MDLSGYCATFKQVDEDFEATVAGFGVPFEEAESQNRSARRESAQWACENGDASLRGGNGWISPACIACRTGLRTATFFISLRCPKQCYFCFNANQEDYGRYLDETRDVVAELEQAHASGAQFDCLALTGGEPMLHAEEVYAFLRRAKELYPKVHTRLYTSGYAFDAQVGERLRDAGLDEIRFSIKLEDDAQERHALQGRIACAVGLINAVMVEMPVIPGTLEEMKELLRGLAACGVKGISLLEFGFPLHNAEEFTARGFRLRKQPYRVLYNYWYAGGIPVAGSEAEALELLRFAADEGLPLGVHYCSSDNKNSGQLYQQNAPFAAHPEFTKRYPYLSFDAVDNLFACAKAFGADVGRVREVLDREKAQDAARPPCYAIDAALPAISFSLGCAQAVAEEIPSAELGKSLSVIERDGKDIRVRELALEVLGSS